MPIDCHISVVSRPVKGIECTFVLAEAIDGIMNASGDGQGKEDVRLVDGVTWRSTQYSVGTFRDELIQI